MEDKIFMSITFQKTKQKMCVLNTSNNSKKKEDIDN